MVTLYLRRALECAGGAVGVGNTVRRGLYITLAHADHVTAAPYLKSKLGGKVAIGDHISLVQDVFKGIFNLENSFASDGSQFDHLLKDGEEIHFGNLTLHAIFVPGHKPYKI